MVHVHPANSTSPGKTNWAAVAEALTENPLFEGVHMCVIRVLNVYTTYWMKCPHALILSSGLSFSPHTQTAP